VLSNLAPDLGQTVTDEKVPVRQTSSSQTPTLMKRPKRIRNVDAEVTNWSDEVSNEAMLDAAEALRRRIRRVDRSHDIPYIAGYSRDGRTVFIDRHMPRSFRFGETRVQTDRFLITHEVVEKALLDQLRLHYLHAHQIALRTEQAAVRAAGVSWRDYDRFTKSHEKAIADERLKRVPHDLDLTPYRDEHDFDLLQRLQAARRSKRAK
jgi:hypothetical protein